MNITTEQLNKMGPTQIANLLAHAKDTQFLEFALQWLRDGGRTKNRAATHWLPGTKLIMIYAADAGLLTDADRAHFALTNEEISEWKTAFKKGGLKTLKLQEITKRDPGTARPKNKPPFSPAELTERRKLKTEAEQAARDERVRNSPLRQPAPKPRGGRPPRPNKPKGPSAT